MKRINVSKMTVEQLVDCFAAIALDQAEAILMDDNAKFNRLFWQMEAVEGQLKARSGDQRLALLNYTTTRMRRCASRQRRPRWRWRRKPPDACFEPSSTRRNFRRPAMPACRSSILIGIFKPT